MSWRLACQLHQEFGIQIRFWVDQPERFQALRDGALRGEAEASSVMARDDRPTPCSEDSSIMTDDEENQGIEILQLQEPFVVDDEMELPEVVIESFGCVLPESYVKAMARSSRPPLWIVLEYLSAEPWVAGMHGLPSPHPQSGLRRYFFFPGVCVGTGGVLREKNLLTRRDHFDRHKKANCWRAWGFEPPQPEALTMLLFAYPHAPWQSLLRLCCQQKQKTIWVLPPTPLAEAVRAFLGVSLESVWRQGSLEIRWIPWLAQTAFDELLWCCDVNFVRGEDSFVRAQWAKKPWVWHIYPQAEEAHEVKLIAFVDRYVASVEGSNPRAAQGIRDMFYAWNGMKGVKGGEIRMEEAFEAYSGLFLHEGRNRNGTLTQGMGDPSAHWEQELRELGDLASNLVQFCQDIV